MRNIVWILLFLYLVVSRSVVLYHQNPLPTNDGLFTIKEDRIREGVYIIALDEAKYCTLARSFPRYHLFGGPYLVHPPFYPASMAFMHAIMPLDASIPFAGMVVSWLASLLAAGAVVWFFLSCGGRGDEVLLGSLIFLSFELPRMYGQLIMKESLFCMLFFISLASLCHGVQERGGRRFFLTLISAVAAGLASITADQGLFLAGLLVITWSLLAGPPKQWRRHWYLLAAPMTGFVISGSWLLTRWLHYRRGGLLSCGVDGTYEDVTRFGLSELMSPHFFPNTAALMNFRLTLDPLAIAARLEELLRFAAPFHDTLTGAMVLAVFLFAGCSVLVFTNKHRHSSSSAFRDERKNDRRRFFMYLALLLVSLLPMINRGTQARMMMTALPAVAGLTSMGAMAILRLLPVHATVTHHMRLIITGCIVSLLLAGAIVRQQGIVFRCSFTVEGAATANMLRDRSEAQIFAQPGYPPELTWLTGREIQALPATEELFRMITDCSEGCLIVFGEHYLTSVDNDGHVFCRRMIEAMLRQPEQYQPLFIVEEQLFPANWPDRMTVLRTGPAIGTGEEAPR